MTTNEGPRTERIVVDTEPADTAGATGRSAALAVVAVVWFFVLLDDTAAAIALPTVGRDLQLGLSSLEWVVNSYTLLFAVFSLAGGMLTDRFGSRPVFTAGLGLFTAFSLISGLSPDGVILIAARAAQGAAAGLIGPAGLALIITCFPGAKRGVALGVWAGVGGSALASGPLIGALLTENIGWRSIFLINVPVGLALLAVARFALVSPRPSRPSARADVAGLVAAAIGLSALIFGLTEANTYGWTSAPLLTALAVAGASCTIFVVIERRSDAPMWDRDLLRLPNFLVANLLGLLTQAVMCSLFFFLSLYLQRAADFTAVRAGMTLLPLTVLIAVSAPVTGWLVSHVSARILISAGMTLTSAGLALLARIEPGWTVRQLMPGLILTGLGIGLATTSTTTTAMASVPTERAGIAGATLNASRTLGLSLGIAVMGAVVAARWPGDLTGAGPDPQAFAAGIASGFVVNAGLALAAAIAAVAMIRSPATPGPATPAPDPTSNSSHASELR